MNKTETTLPQHTLEALNNYKLNGHAGGFLSAVLENNLKEALGRADLENRAALFAIVSWCYNEMPSQAWGSKEKVAEWVDAGGLRGISKDRFTHEGPMKDEVTTDA